MAAGDYIDVYAEQIAAQRMWNDPRNNRELQKPVETAMAALKEQAVTFVPVMKNGRCVAVEAIYLKSCNDDVVDVGLQANNISDCDVDGDEAEAAKKTYTPNIFLTKSIKVSEDDCAGFTNFEEKLAFEKLKAKTALEVEFNKKIIAALVANATAPAASSVLTGTIAGTTVGYGAGNFDGANGAKLLAEWNIVAQREQIYDAYIMNGTNFYESHWLYPFKEKAGSAERFDTVFDRGPGPMYWDITALDAVSGADASSFLVDKSAIAFFGKNEYAGRRELKSDLFTYTEPSMRLSYRDGQSMMPIQFDVTEQWSCAISGATVVQNRRYRVVNIEYVLRGGIILGPPDCGGGTGIIHFNQI